MHTLKLSFLIFMSQLILFAQTPGQAYNPMTAPGARNIDNYQHTLFWINPADAEWNECYLSADSSLVANMHPSVRIQNGFPSTVNDSVVITPLQPNIKYFWRVVEHNSAGYNPSPIWYFRSLSPYIFGDFYWFPMDLQYWEPLGPEGMSNWYWSNTSNAGGETGEMAISGSPVFSGESYIMSLEIPAAFGTPINIWFRCKEEYVMDTVLTGCAISSDSGNSWTTLFELDTSAGFGPSVLYADFIAPGNFRLGIYYKGNSGNIDHIYIDDITYYTEEDPPVPPGFLKAAADIAEKKVVLNWIQGGSPDPITAYTIYRKHGLPEDSSSYVFLMDVDPALRTFTDTTAEFNKDYTYIISTISGSSISYFSNEATVYMHDFPNMVEANLTFPEEYSLSQNYPNPFNPATTLKFSIPKEVHVNLTVFNILGEQVKELKNEVMKSGYYEVEFSASGGNASHLSSGVYFYRIKAGDFVQTKKMLLLK